MDLSDYELMIYAMIGVAWLLYSAIIGIGPALLLRWKVHPEPYTKGMAVGIQVVLEILKMLYRLVLADYLDMEPTKAPPGYMWPFVSFWILMRKSKKVRTAGKEG